MNANTVECVEVVSGTALPVDGALGDQGQAPDHDGEDEIWSSRPVRDL